MKDKKNLKSQGKTITKGSVHHVDTCDIPQYPERIVDDVQVLETPSKHATKVLCHSPMLRANILVPHKDLRG